MTGQILTAARIGCRSTYGDRDRVLDPAGVAPTVLANWGAKCPPPLVAVRKVTE